VHGSVHFIWLVVVCVYVLHDGEWHGYKQFSSKVYLIRLTSLRSLVSVALLGSLLKQYVEAASSLKVMKEIEIGMVDQYSVHVCQVRHGNPLNLSILIRGGKETKKDSLSNGE
jgi:hypothetical protein